MVPLGSGRLGPEAIILEIDAAKTLDTRASERRINTFSG
jgi:hypothetical protein